MPNTPLPEWEKLLASAAHLQKIVPETVMATLDDTDLRQYKKLKPEYQDWLAVAEKCRAIANVLW